MTERSTPPGIIDTAALRARIGQEFDEELHLGGNEARALLTEVERLRTYVNEIRDSACARSDHKHIDALRKAAARLVCPTNGGNHPHGFVDDKGKLSGQCACGIWWQEACEAARLISESKP